MNHSDKIFEEALKLIPGGVNSPVRAFRAVGGTPFVTKSANGAHLTTVDGDTLIDYVCTWGPAIHGHNHPTIRAAIADALENGTSFGTPNNYEVPMANAIIARFPSIEQVRMTNSGTEATMSAIRLARGYTNRDKIIKFNGCYHGHSDSLLVKAGSGALTQGTPDSAGVPKSVARETIVLEYNDFETLESLFTQRGGEIAGVIVEPFPANVGLIFPKRGYLEKLRDLCTSHGSVLIFDEVMTGFRVAPGGVQQISGIKPDLTTLGKIIGGGLPVGAFGGKREIMQLLAPVGPVYQAGTLSGNPLAMAAGITSLNMLKDEKYELLEQKGTQIKAALLTAAKQKGIPLQVPQIGSMFSLFFTENTVTNYSEAVASDKNLFNEFFHYCLAHGVYLPPSAYETAFISTAHSAIDIDKTCEVFAEAIKNL